MHGLPMIKGLYTAPPGCATIKAIARSLAEITGGDAQALRECLILLPTRRAIRALEEELLNHFSVPTVLLPKIMAIGDIELPPEDEESGRLPPRSINGLERIASLMPYVEKHGLGGGRFEGAWRMAQEIAKLLDLLQTEDLAVDSLSVLLKESDVAEQWQRYGQVFEVIAREWLDDLARHKRINAAAGRSLRIETLMEIWEDAPPQASVWLIGSTGSIPAVRRLMKQILSLPQGAVMLPGLDTRLSDAAWAAINDAHPQAILKETITALNYDRREILSWPDCDASPAILDRHDWLSAALSPFPKPYAPQHANDISLMVANTAQEEAEAITEYCLWHFEAQPDKSLVIMTNDNGLTSKLLPLLEAYRISLDPSAGLQLQDTSFGQGLSLFLRLLSPSASYLDLWTLLKHENFIPGWPMAEREAVLTLQEDDVLRKPLYRPDGLDGVLALLPDKHAGKLKEARTKIVGQKPLAGWAAFLANEIALHFALRAATDKLAYEETMKCLDTLATLPLSHDLSYEDAIGPLRDQLLQIGLRLPHQPGRVVHILGTMEARLINADTVIMAGLNEGKWPDMPQPSPFLSRGMRHQLGVPDSERHAALSGHDFQQAFLMPRVVLSYAMRDDSTPVLPARWLMRLKAVTPPADWDEITQRGDSFLHQRKARHTPQRFIPAQPPAPVITQNQIVFPLFVTQLETWRNDPYSFWAKHVCHLRRKEPVFAEISAADKGTLWHKIFKAFAEGFDAAMDDKAAFALFDTCVGQILDEDHIPLAKRRVWRKRLESAVPSFIQFERARRAYSTPILEKKWTGDIGPYTISAKADRVDETLDNTYMLADYKTGEAPAGIDVTNGYACQLSALALIMKNNVTRLEYVTIKGGRDPFDTKPVSWTSELSDATKDGIVNWIDMFVNAQHPFVSLADIRPKSLSKARDYLHLARHKEWGISA